MKLIYGDINDKARFDQLVDANLHLRRTTANHVLRLWENLTNRSQSVNSDLLSEIDHILSCSYYYDLNAKSNYYSAKLVLIGFNHPRSQSKICVNLCIGECGTSSCSNYKGEMTVEFDENSKERRCLSFIGSTTFASMMCKRGFYCNMKAGSTEVSSDICPRFSVGLVICLFTMMVHPVRRTEFISYLKNIGSLYNRY